MQTRYQSVEIPQIDPRVAQMQARAESYLNTNAAQSWFNTPLGEPEVQRNKVSDAIQSWNSKRPTGLPGQGGQAGSPIDASMDDRELLARTLMAEAGGEGFEGLLAAGAVIANRTRTSGYGDGLRGVIMKPGQFSAWNSVTGYANGQGGLDMSRIKANQDAYRVADMIISGNYQDPTGGATHYYNPAVATPKWGREAGGNWLTIGNHIFGRADGQAGRNV